MTMLRPVAREIRASASGSRERLTLVGSTTVWPPAGRKSMISSSAVCSSRRRRLSRFALKFCRTQPTFDRLTGWEARPLSLAGAGSLNITAKSMSRCSWGSVTPMVSDVDGAEHGQCLPGECARHRVLLVRLLRDGRPVRLDVAAPAAGSQLLAPVEALDRGLQILLDVADVHGDLVQSRVAALAEPDEGLCLGELALDLDDETPGVGRAVRRVRRQGGHQEHAALADDLRLTLAALHVFEDHVALEHVKDLVGGVDVEVAARVRPADDHGRELRILPDDLVAHGRLERVAVLLDPAPEGERRQRLHDRTSTTPPVGDTRTRSPLRSTVHGSGVTRCMTEIPASTRPWIMTGFVRPKMTAAGATPRWTSARNAQPAATPPCTAGK